MPYQLGKLDSMRYNITVDWGKYDISSVLRGGGVQECLQQIELYGIGGLILPETLLVLTQALLLLP